MATITVQVNDTNGFTFGMRNVYVVLYDVANNTSTQVQTNASGAAVFSSLAAGQYSVYNTGIDTTGQNPPTSCGFPAGYNGTRTARRLDFTLAASDSVTATFSYDSPRTWSSLNGGNPPNYGMTSGAPGAGVNLATGQTSAIPNVGNNGMGYNTIDNMIYGSNIARTDGNGTTQTMILPQTLALSGIMGDIDNNGYLYGPPTLSQTGRFTCVDLNPFRTTYLRPVNPYLNFQEITTFPYEVSFTPAPLGFNTQDWSYVESVQGLVTGASANRLYVLSLTTPLAYNVPIVGLTYGGSGVTMSDRQHLYVTTGTQIQRFQVSTTVANGSVLSLSSASNTGDGARAYSAAVFYANPETRKTVNKATTTIGETLKYTITIENTGVITGNNTFFYDTLPAGLSFIPNTLFVNNVQQPPSVNLTSVPIGSLAVGAVVTITFDALVNSSTIPLFTNQGIANTSYTDTSTGIPYNINYISNNVNTRNLLSYLNTSKRVDKAYATIGETLTYTITISNTTADTALNTILLDTTPIGTNFISNTIRVNGVLAPSGSTLYPTGLNLGTIPGRSSTTVTFNVIVVSVPSGNIVQNSAVLNYQYIDSTNTITFGSGTTIANTLISVASIPSITKFVDKVYATCGDTLTYIITIPNSGNVTANNVFFKDTIPNGTSFVANSVYVNSSNQPGLNPGTGITIPNIGPNSTSSISFQVIVNC